MVSGDGGSDEHFQNLKGLVDLPQGGTYKGGYGNSEPLIDPLPKGGAEVLEESFEVRDPNPRMDQKYRILEWESMTPSELEEEVDNFSGIKSGEELDIIDVIKQLELIYTFVQNGYLKKCKNAAELYQEKIKPVAVGLLQQLRHYASEQENLLSVFTGEYAKPEK